MAQFLDRSYTVRLTDAFKEYYENVLNGNTSVIDGEPVLVMKMTVNGFPRLITCPLDGLSTSVIMPDLPGGSFTSAELVTIEEGDLVKLTGDLVIKYHFTDQASVIPSFDIEILTIRASDFTEV